MASQLAMAFMTMLAFIFSDDIQIFHHMEPKQNTHRYIYISPAIIARFDIRRQ